MKFGWHPLALARLFLADSILRPSALLCPTLSFPLHCLPLPHTQNVRMWFLMGGIVAAVVFLIVLAACGWNFKHC